MKKLTIAIIAPTEDPVLLPSQFKGYGGTERFVSRLAEGLLQKGHKVHVFAPGNSQTSAELHPTLPVSLRSHYSDDELQRYGNRLKLEAMQKAAVEIEELQPDIIHNNYAWRFIESSKDTNIPLVSTVHSDISVAQDRETFLKFKNLPYISISNDQRKRLPELHWIKTVYHGENIDEYTMGQPAERSHFTFIGRTSPHKGLADAIREIQKTNEVLKIAAKVGPDEESIAYFEEWVEPFIDNTQIIFLGEIGDIEKKRLLTTSKGLLMLNDVARWQEPFGLTATEAMSAGVPVIATKSGALTELIEHGVTGFLLDSTKEAHTYIQRIAELDPQASRDRIKTHFSLEQMIDEYEKVFYKLLET